MTLMAHTVGLSLSSVWDDESSPYPSLLIKSLSLDDSPSESEPEEFYKEKKERYSISKIVSVGIVNETQSYLTHNTQVLL